MSLIIVGVSVLVLAALIYAFWRSAIANVLVAAAFAAMGIWIITDAPPSDIVYAKLVYFGPFIFWIVVFLILALRAYRSRRRL